MSALDPIGFLNHPLPGDPQGVRSVIVVVVMIAAFCWTKDVRDRWSTQWSGDYAIKRNALWLTALLVTNGALLLGAAQRDDPIRVGTGILGFVFLGLTTSLLLPNKPLLRILSR